MKNFFKGIAQNWRTTLAGVIVVGGGVVKLVAPQYGGIADMAQWGAIGVGLITAADAQKMAGVVGFLQAIKGPKPAPAPALEAGK